MIIAAVGDIMPGGILAGVNSGYVSQEVLSILNKADVRVGTLETAIGNEPNFYEEKMKRDADVIYSKDHDLLKLKHLSIDIVSLANNHFFDLGPEGELHTIQLLDQMGIQHVGAGRNLQEASAPVIKNIQGQTVAFLAFCDPSVGWCSFAAKDTIGINPMYDDFVVAEIKKYKTQCDYVVVMPHWGMENTWITTPHVYRLTKKMIKAGADLILGSHPHRVQPVVNYKRTSVAYSMGNFLFPDRLIVKPRSTYYPDAPIDLSNLPVTDAYPYVECVTYKKWKPLARVGMIVKSEFSKDKTFSSYQLTREDEDGFISLYKDDKISSILKRRGRLLKYCSYPMVWLLEKYGTIFLHKIGIRRRQ